MIYPKTIEIGGIKYTVSESKAVVIDDNAGYAGKISYATSEIEILNKLPDDRKLETFIHELMHALFFESGYIEHDEDMVVRLSKTLYQVIRSNQWKIVGGSSE
jgi:predicted metallopeptidase